MSRQRPEVIPNMSNQQQAAELQRDFWKSLKSDRTVMLGLSAERDTHLRPMTGLIEGDEGGPVWFFTAVDTELAQAIKGARKAVFTLASKGHEVFAAVHGTVQHDLDRRVVDELWNPMVAAWYEHGKDDPKLALLRFDCEEAQIWRNGSSLVAGVKALLGVDPKKDYQSNVATVQLDNSGT